MDQASSMEYRPADQDETAAWLAGEWGPEGVIETEEGVMVPVHHGHYSHLSGTYYCDTCQSPYCDLIG